MNRPIQPDDSPTAADQSVARDFVQLPRRQIAFTMVGVLLAMFLAALDQTVVATAMPRIIADLGGFDRYTWVTTAYLLASTTAVPIVGRLTDIYGRKIFYVGGIVVFLIGSALAGTSQTMNQLIAFRAVQGLGGGVIMANSFVAIADLFPPETRGKYQGFIGVVFGLSSIIGPTLGGFITDAASWNWVFLVNLPLGIPVIFLIAFLFPKINPEVESRKLDYAGMVALILAVVPTLLALSWGGAQYAWTSPMVVAPLAFGLAMAAAFVFIESRAESPIMPLEIYRNPMVAVSLIATFLTGFGMFGGIIFIPLFFQGVLGASATSSGGFLTPMMLGVVFGASVSGQLLARTPLGYRTFALFGTALMAGGLFLMTTLSADTTFPRAVSYIVAMGVGLGCTFPTFTLAVQNSIPFRLMGVATSALQFYRTIGGTLGLALLGAVIAARFASRLDAAEIPEPVRDALPSGALESLKDNPQGLMDQSALQGIFPNGGADLAKEFLAVLQDALAGAIGDVFTVSLMLVAASVLATLFLRAPKPKSPTAASERRGAPESGAEA